MVIDRWTSTTYLLHIAHTSSFLDSSERVLEHFQLFRKFQRFLLSLCFSYLGSSVVLVWMFEKQSSSLETYLTLQQRLTKLLLILDIHTRRCFRNDITSLFLPLLNTLLQLTSLFHYKFTILQLLSLVSELVFERWCQYIGLWRSLEAVCSLDYRREYQSVFRWRMNTSDAVCSSLCFVVQTKIRTNSRWRACSLKRFSVSLSSRSATSRAWFASPERSKVHSFEWHEFFFSF